MTTIAYTVFQKTGPLKQIGITLSNGQSMSVTNDFLQNASTFNWGLIAYEKLDTG